MAEKGKGDGYSLNNANEYSVIDIAKAFGSNIVYRERYSGRKDSGKISSKARVELGWKTTVDVIDYINKFKEKHPIQKSTN